MFCFKFDEDKIKATIDIYKEENGNYPYLIISSETAERLPDEYTITTPTYNSVFIYGSSLSDRTDRSKDATKQTDKSTRAKWHNAKILIDDDLKFGEVLVK